MCTHSTRYGGDRIMGRVSKVRTLSDDKESDDDVCSIFDAYEKARIE